MVEPLVVDNEDILLESNDNQSRRMLEAARHAAASDAIVLLNGESGSGKSVLARQIHRWSRRAQFPFLTVNCAMLPENQLENELFGQMYGGSTGTVSDKPGRLKAADGGTVFLEEISNMAAAVQAKFLRFVEEQTFECVGGEQAIRLHLRIIVASSRDLAAEVAAHRFREDLYYRLSVITLQVPALHERTGDILRLATQMLSVAAARYNRPELRFSPDASFALVHHRWPGNLRELRNVVERAAVLCPGEVISAECLPDVLHRSQSQSLAAVLTSARLDDVEREHIIRVMAASRTLEDAANRLGINLSTLWRRRKRYGLDSIAIASKQ